MNVAAGAFTVLTEFKFEVGHAVAATKTLESQVERVSNAATRAQRDIFSLGSSIFASFGLGYLSTAGMIVKAFQASEKFYQSQLKISNIFLSNSMFTGANAFEHSMDASADALERMKQTARQFSLPASDMAQMATSVGAALTVKGLDDSSLGKSIDISRQFLKSAPVLLPGMDTTQYQGQLIGAISGRADLGGMLIQRLIDETGAMKQFSGKGGLSKFNALDPAVRLQKLTDALGQFSSQTKIADGIANSFTGQMQRLSDNLFSQFSIFRKIGDAINKPMAMILGQLNKWLETEGESVANQFAVLVDRIFKDPLRLYHNLQQLQGLRADFSITGKILGIMGVVQGLTWFLAVLTKYVPGLAFLGPAANGLASFAGKLGEFFMPTGALMKGLSGASIGQIGLRLLSFIRIFISSFAALLFFFQILTRAESKARVANLKWIADNLDRMMEMFNRFTYALSAIFAPLTMAIDQVSDWVAWLFRLDVTGDQTLWLLDKFIMIFELLGKVVIGVLSGISGIMGIFRTSLETTMGFNDDRLRKDGLMGGLKLFGEGFMDSAKMVWDPWYGDKAKEAKGRPVSGQTTNIGKVELHNNFKETLDADRIAFTLFDQIQKVAINPRQSSGRSLPNPNF